MPPIGNMLLFFWLTFKKNRGKLAVVLTGTGS